ncbi:MAG: DNA-directed RNA polymerase subunit H [Candidatus Bathyarchaeota archaeon B23]|nr:MAG: DNA-directed RNA polymerase subunit H [Candidatus Bathyarchaeota archaeon B23]
MEAESLEERRAALIIKYRGLEVEEVEREGNKVYYYLRRGEDRYVILCVLGEKTIGISYIRDLKEKVEQKGAARGILIGGGHYTYSARSTVERLNDEVTREGRSRLIELIPPSLPAFDIFQHELVPIHEILSEEERREVLEQYHVKPYQLPWIKASDPIAIIVGAEPGDILRVRGRSETAGEYISYRYVVE